MKTLLSLEKNSKKEWARNRAEAVLNFMPTRAILFLLTNLLAFDVFGQKLTAAPYTPVQPESFYATSFDDRQWRILDVQPASAEDTRIREINVYPACGTYHVHEDDFVIEHVSVADLSQKADLCVSQENLSSIVHLLERKNRKHEEWNEIGGSLAQCGAEKIVHRLPARESLRFDLLEKKAPQLAALWTLTQEIHQRNLDEDKDSHWFIIHRDMAERHLSMEAATEIRNGDFDLGLPDLPDRLAVNGKRKLSDLMPSPEEATSPEEDYGVAQNVERLGLEKTGPIPYPQMARIAHIVGDVTVTLQIDVASGAVSTATTSSGHPILQYSAKDALKSWVFTHPYFGPNPVEVLVRYELHCPPVISTQVSTTSRKTKKHTLKKKPQPLNPPKK